MDPFSSLLNLKFFTDVVPYLVVVVLFLVFLRWLLKEQSKSLNEQSLKHAAERKEARAEGREEVRALLADAKEDRVVDREAFLSKLTDIQTGFTDKFSTLSHELSNKHAEALFSVLQQQGQTTLAVQNMKDVAVAINKKLDAEDAIKATVLISKKTVKKATTRKMQA